MPTKLPGLHSLVGPMGRMAVVDCALAMAAVWMAMFIRAGFEMYSAAANFGPVLPRAVSFAALLMLGLASMGMYRSRQRPRQWETAARVVLGVGIGGFLFILLQYVFPQLTTGRGIFGLSISLAAVLLVAGRLGMLKLIDSNEFKRRVLVIGAGTVARTISMLRRASDRRRFQVIGYVPVNEQERAEAERDGVGPLLDLESAISDSAKIDEVVVALDHHRRDFPTRMLLERKCRGVRITNIIRFLEEETGKIELDVMDPEWLVFAETRHSYPIYALAKRSFDALGGTVLLLLASPIFLLVYLAIKFECGFRQPAFFRQKRVGRFERTFDLLKFRSMVVDAEAESGPQWSPRHGDSRVTAVGRLIRRIRADELPQLINVIRGDMSIVGPRPERPEFVQELSAGIPFYDYRHSVRPGLTGWAQLNFPYGESLDDARTKLKYDLYYISNASVLFDIAILLQTVEVVVWGRAISMTGPGGPRMDPSARRDAVLSSASGSRDKKNAA